MLFQPLLLPLLALDPRLLLQLLRLCLRLTWSPGLSPLRLWLSPLPALNPGPWLLPVSGTGPRLPVSEMGSCCPAACTP